MNYDQHSLRAADLESWSLAMLAAIRLYWLLAALWVLWTQDPWEGAVVMLPSLGGLLAVQVLLWRARWHMRQMRACVDRLQVRR